MTKKRSFQEIFKINLYEIKNKKEEDKKNILDRLKNKCQEIYTRQKMKKEITLEKYSKSFNDAEVNF